MADLSPRKTFWVVSSRADVITEDEFELDEEGFSEGYTIVGYDFGEPVHADFKAAWRIPRVPVVGAGSLQKPPYMLRAIPRATAGEYAVLLSWEVEEKLGRLEIESVTVAVSHAVGTVASKATFAIYTISMGENVPAMTLEADLSAEPVRLEASFTHPLGLRDGFKTIAGLIGCDVDLGSLLPFNRLDLQPALAHARLVPGQELNVTLTLETAGGGNFSWSPVAGVEVENPVVRINLTPGGAELEVVSGAIVLHGAELDMMLQPKVAFDASLSTPLSVDVQELIRDIFGNGFSAPSLRALSLDAMEVHHDLAAHARSYDIRVGGHLDLLGDSTFQIEQVRLAARSENGKTVSRTLGGVVSMAGRSVYIDATRQEKGWLLEGGLAQGTTIPLGALCDDLLHRWHVASPPGLTSMELTDLGISMDTADRTFGLEAAARYHLPDELPWGGGTYVFAVVALESAKDPQTGRRHLDIDVNWELGDESVTFDAYASHTVDRNAFKVLWRDEKKPLGLKRLGEVLHLERVVTLPDEASWDLFAFRAAAVEYVSKPRRIEFSAETKLGDGYVAMNGVMETGRRSFTMYWEPERDGAVLSIQPLLKAVGITQEPPLLGALTKSIFTFREVSLQYYADPKPKLILDAKTADGAYESAFTVISKDAGTWGFVVGMTFNKGTTLASIPGVKDLPGVAELLGAIRLTPTLLMASTVERKSFTVPEAAAGNAATLSGRSLPLHKGATVAGKINLDGSGSKIIRNLSKILSVPEIDGQFSVGPNGASVAAVLPKDLTVKAGGAKLLMKHPAVQLGFQSGVVSAQILGEIDFSLFGRHLQFGGRLMVDPEAVAGSVHVADGVPLPSPAAFPGVHFKKDYYLEIGVQFEPDGMDVGFMGDFYIGPDPNKYNGRAVMVVDMIGEIPDPLYVYLSIKELDLAAWMEAQFGVASRMEQAAQLAGKIAGGPPPGGELIKSAFANLECVLGKVAFHDVTLHWAQQAGVLLPDGTSAPMGAGFTGWFDLLGLHSFASVEFSTGGVPSFQAMFTADPINLLGGALRVGGDGRGIEVSADWQPDKALDWSQPEARKAIKGAPAASTKKQIVKPGGPVFELNTTHSPFLHARADVSLFGLSASVQMEATDTGFGFDMHLGAGSIAGLDLNCHLQTKGGFDFRASGDFHVDINVDTDPIIPGLDFTAIHLHTGFNGHMDVHVTSSVYEVHIGGGFYFENMHLQLPALTITVPLGQLADLAAKIGQHIKDKALEIFGDIWNGLQKAYKAMKEAAEAVYQEGKKIVGAIGDTAKEGIRMATAAAGIVGDEVKKATEAVAKKTLEVAEAGVKKVKEIAADAVKVATVLYDEGKRAVEAAIGAVADLGRHLIADVAQIGQDIANIAHQAAEYVDRALQEAAQFAQSVVADARKVADALVNTANDIANGIANAASAAWNKAKEIGDEISHFFSNVGHAVDGAVHTVAHFFSSLF